jgi:hypothetical protein
MVDKKAKYLLLQIIEHSEEEDMQSKIKALREGKGEEAVGESWMTFHLKILKKLLNDEKEKKE